MQAPGGRKRTAGVELSAADGAMGTDNEAMAFVVELTRRADAFLFGRWTFELFAD